MMFVGILNSTFECHSDFVRWVLIFQFQLCSLFSCAILEGRAFFFFPYLFCILQLSRCLAAFPATLCHNEQVI